MLLLKAAAALRARLIDDVRRAGRFWSLRLGALALAVQSLLAVAPDAAIGAWNALPVELKTLLPVHYVNVIAAGLTLAALVARVVKQKAPTDGR